DLEVRLSADSVEKYRDQISDIISRIRRKRKYGQGDSTTAEMDWRAVMELRLRKLLPHRVVPGQSLLENLLHTIEARLKNACEVMLPALRRALNTFTQRADIIIRQLNYMHAQGGDELVELCRLLAGQTQEEQDRLFADKAVRLERVSLGYLDPGQIQLRAPRERRFVKTSLDEDKPLDEEARKQLYIQQMLDQAFSLQNKEVRDFVYRSLASTRRINS